MEAKALIMGFFYGVVVIELLICIIKMFIDTKNMKEDSRIMDQLLESDMEAHIATMTIIDDIAKRLNVIENKIGISHEDKDENEKEEEE